MEIGNRHSDRQIMSQINVTPFVDVMLVLLVIFMITAPMMQQGMQVNLPKTEAKSMEVKDAPVIVTIDRSGRAFIDKSEIPPGQLKAKLAAIFSSRSKKEVFLKADRDVPYGDVVRAMAEIKGAGIERLGMLTEPSGAK
jgi:biopolymer transport protein TolR